MLKELAGAFVRGCGVASARGRGMAADLTGGSRRYGIPGRGSARSRLGMGTLIVRADGHLTTESTLVPAAARLVVSRSTPSTAARISAADAKRRSGLFAIARDTMRSTAGGTSVRADGTGTGAWICARSTAAGSDRS